MNLSAQSTRPRLEVMTNHNLGAKLPPTASTTTTTTNYYHSTSTAYTSETMSHTTINNIKHTRCAPLILLHLEANHMLPLQAACGPRTYAYAYAHADARAHLHLHLPGGVCTIDEAAGVAIAATITGGWWLP